VEKKAVPEHAYGGAGGERIYSSYSFTTSALDVGEWSASPPGLNLPGGKRHLLPIVQDAEWAPEPLLTQKLDEKFLAAAQTLY
jgi:hypothetical protein